MRFFKLCGLVLMLAAGAGLPAASALTAKTITVCPSGCDFPQIQAAIDSAAEGDTIQVRAGTYRERLVIQTKRLTLLGDGSDQVIVESPATSVVTLSLSDSAIGDDVIISGFTLRGEIALFEAARAEIGKNVIEGGIRVTDQSIALIGDNRINVPGQGDAVAVTDEATARIENNEITGGPGLPPFIGPKRMLGWATCLVPLR